MGWTTLKKGDMFNGKYVKEYMKQHEITVKEIAELLEVSESSVSAWLHDRVRPYAWNAFFIIVYLGLDENEVIIQRE